MFTHSGDWPFAASDFTNLHPGTYPPEPVAGTVLPDKSNNLFLAMKASLDKGPEYYSGPVYATYPLKSAHSALTLTFGLVVTAVTVVMIMSMESAAS